MTAATRINWSDVEQAARQMAGNWREFESFVWYRASNLVDPDRWMVWYTSNRDAGLLEQSNEKVINERLALFAEGEDPDVVFERHSSSLIGYLDGFSLRVLRPDGTITDAFREFCRIRERVADYPILDEQDYSEREFAATLENYCLEMWSLRDELPDGWAAEVFSWFSDHNQDRYTANVDDQGGWAPREAIVEALQDLGLLPTVLVAK